jgi:hypothetical protein
MKIRALLSFATYAAYCFAFHLWHAEYYRVVNQLTMYHTWHGPISSADIARLLDDGAMDHGLKIGLGIVLCLIWFWPKRKT